MAQGNSSGGPKTAKGKTRSSKNATSHGLTSLKPSNPNEKALVESYSKELVDYYQPQSPLEQLQIQRIAICRAKLNYLYELEQVKLELAAKEIASEPEKILERIPGAKGMVLAMAKDLILEGQIYLPCRLNLALLEVICQEIEQFHGVVTNKHQFARALPKLTKYLNSYPVVGLNNTDHWMEKLESVQHDIEQAFDLDGRSAGKWSELMQAYLVGKQYEDHMEKEAMKAELDELDRYQEQRRIERGLKPVKVQPAPMIDPDAISDLVKLKAQLNVFPRLLRSHGEAQKVVEQYGQIKDLMMRAISLPAAESDLLMRYQTTLERRLSSAIGELLALQRSLKV